MPSLRKRRLHRLLAAVPVALLASCGTVTGTALPEPVPPTRVAHHPAPQAAPSQPRLPAPRPAPAEGNAEAKGLLEAAATVEPDVTIGALVVDRTSGDPVLSLHADRQFRCASLVKLLIAIDILENGPDGGTRPVTDKDRADIGAMLGASDDTVASAYWVAGGYSDIIVRTSEKLGLTATEPPEEPGRWGDMRISAADVVRVYTYILGMPLEDRRLILAALEQAPRFAADGFEQHFGIPDGLRSTWAVKQGWGDNDTAMVLHSTGLVGEDWRYIVVLLTEHPLGTDWGTAAASVTAAAGTLRVLPGL
ncbi:hypothetical protein [Actinophytocola xanthii]|uniref:Serine hydrolase n=1 Tax=Actinophytocola xanthii TaxID=1912961 RepID=A0A1Q8CT38_9PSEU|nr:hypothetical protein [Actinophytocola xanthii]OLF17513.1 hypothetical protein BU204_11320 [Actinophytocola xanthii]